MAEIVKTELMEKHTAEEQKKLGWREKILVHLQEHLYIVEREGKKIVKCDCGYEFGNYKTDWKFSALVYDRNPKDIYPGITGHDPDWVVYREFYCPGCGALLDVEAVPHGIPFIQYVELGLD